MMRAIAATAAVAAAQPAPAAGGSRIRGLLIGVAGYPAGKELPGAPRDAEAWERHLRDRFDVPDSQITRLNTPERTRRSALIAALAALPKAVRVGEAVLITYSGHGSQITDDDARPDEADGLDECLVAADWTPTGPGKAAALIRDDVIADTMRACLAAGAATVTLVVDSCHSGTAARGGYRTRGVALDSLPRRADGKPLRPEDDLATRSDRVEAFYAAQAKELALERADHGLFTAAMLRAAVPGARNPLIELQVRETVGRDTSRQTPWAECHDRPFLSVEPAGFAAYRITALAPDKRSATVNVGSIHAVAQGALLAVYDPADAFSPVEGLRPPPEPRRKAILRITEVRPLESAAELYGAGELPPRGRCLLLSSGDAAGYAVLAEAEARQAFPALPAGLGRGPNPRHPLRLVDSTAGGPRLRLAPVQREDGTTVLAIEQTDGTALKLRRTAAGKTTVGDAYVTNAEIRTDLPRLLDVYQRMLEVRDLQNPEFPKVRQGWPVRCELQLRRPGEAGYTLAQPDPDGVYRFPRHTLGKLRFWNAPAGDKPVAAEGQDQWKFYFSALLTEDNGAVTPLEAADSMVPVGTARAPARPDWGPLEFDTASEGREYLLVTFAQGAAVDQRPLKQSAPEVPQADAMRGAAEPRGPQVSWFTQRFTYQVTAR